jgi:hypothetical protein
MRLFFYGIAGFIHCCIVVFFPRLLSSGGTSTFAMLCKVIFLPKKFFNESDCKKVKISPAAKA